MSNVKLGPKKRWLLGSTTGALVRVPAATIPSPLLLRTGLYDDMSTSDDPRASTPAAAVAAGPAAADS